MTTQLELFQTNDSPLPALGEGPGVRVGETWLFVPIIHNKHGQPETPNLEDVAAARYRARFGADPEYIIELETPHVLALGPVHNEPDL